MQALHVDCCCIYVACIAGRVGSAFAAELGTMAVSEQTDSLRMLGSDPIDYLVTPRVVACSIALPILNVMCFLMGARFWAPASTIEVLLWEGLNANASLNNMVPCSLPCQGS